MAPQAITAAYAQRLKRRAKSMAKLAGVPLHAALNELATRHGYPNWSRLARSVESA